METCNDLIFRSNGNMDTFTSLLYCEPSKIHPSHIKEPMDKTSISSERAPFHTISDPEHDR